MSIAFIFPGQGSQSVGMGADLAEAFASAREVFQEVDDALGQKLFALMREGPDSDLTLTENAQPALMAVSLAVARVLEKEFGIGIERAAFVAGHSLGEYSALAAAGASSALAQSAAAKATVDAAKVQGVVGEQADGYLGIVAGADAALREAVTDINTVRAAAYKDIAVKTGVTPEAAGQATAKQLYSRLAPGQYWKPLDGGWMKK